MSIPPQHPRRTSFVSDQLPATVTGGSMSGTSVPHSAASHTTTSQTSPAHLSANQTAAQPLTPPLAGAPCQNGSATSSSSIPAVPHVAWSPPSLITSMATPQDYESATPRLLIAPPLTPGVSPPPLTTPSTRPIWNDGKDSPVAGGTHQSPGFSSPLVWLNLPPQDLHHFLQTVQGPNGAQLPMQEIWQVQRAGGQIPLQANGVNHSISSPATHNGVHNGTHPQTNHAPYAPPGLEQDFWSDEDEIDIHLPTTGAATTIQTTQSGPSQGLASLAGGSPQPMQSIEELVEQIAHDIGEDSPGSPGAAGSQAQAGTGSVASSSSTSNGPLVRTSQWSLPPHPGSQDRGSL